MARISARLAGVGSLALAVATAAFVPTGAIAQTSAFSGEGSHSSNPRLAGSDGSAGDMAPPPVMVTNDRLVAGPPPNKVLPDGPVGPAPREQRSPFFDSDWSISLRGSYEHGTDDGRFVASTVPAFALLHTGRRSTITLEGSAELIADDEGSRQLRGAQGTLDLTYQLDDATEASLGLRGSLSREDPAAPGADDDIVSPPFEADGSATAGLSRRFNRLGIEATGNVARHHETETGLAGGTVRAGAPSSYWQAGATLRAGFEVTPILTPFVEGDVTHALYDDPSESTGVKRDGWDYAIRGGLAANWRDVITTEASIGYGVRSFDAGSIAELRSTLYALDFTYTPNDVLEVDAGLSSTIEAADPDAGEPASTVYAANVDAAYGVNSVLTLRGALAGSVTRPQGDGLNGYGYTAGAGADLSLNKRTNLTFDYTYEFTRDRPDPDEHAHGVTLGLTFSQ